MIRNSQWKRTLRASLEKSAHGYTFGTKAVFGTLIHSWNLQKPACWRHSRCHQRRIFNVVALIHFWNHCSALLPPGGQTADDQVETEIKRRDASVQQVRHACKTAWVLWAHLESHMWHKWNEQKQVEHSPGVDSEPDHILHRERQKRSKKSSDISRAYKGICVSDITATTWNNVDSSTMI